MRQLIAFLDILGTSEKVKRGHFDDLIALDFVNPVGVAARYMPKIQFAAFSDSVLVSADITLVTDFIATLTFMHRQWFSDNILVRGGVSVGDIRWVEVEEIEHLFRGLSNFRYARVYGRGLVDAIALEQKSGPGAICFLSDSVASILHSAIAESVFNGPTKALVWANEKQVNWLIQLFTDSLEGEVKETDARRHLQATLWYLKQLKAGRHFLPDEQLPVLARY